MDKEFKRGTGQSKSKHHVNRFEDKERFLEDVHWSENNS